MGKKIHKSGTKCGYEELPDGSIIPAPLYRDEMLDFIDQEESIHLMLQFITDQCHRRLSQIHKRKRQWWSKVREDYNLDYDNYTWTYDYVKNLLERVLIEKKGAPLAKEEGE